MLSYEELWNSIVCGRRDQARELINTLLVDGKNPKEIISNGLIKAMSIVSQKWQAGDVFIPEVILSSHIVNEGLQILKPLLTGDSLKDIHAGKFVIGTVRGDVHDIGKNLVSLILQTGGFEIIDLGVDVSTDRFVEAVAREQPDILGLSALLTLTMPHMKEVIEALGKSKLREKIYIMVGGAPVTQEYAKTIGADAYAWDAISALEKARQIKLKS